MSFLDLAKKITIEQPVESKPKSGPGKGKKQCLECKEYVGARSKVCNFCQYDFELQTPCLFSNIQQKTIIDKLKITPDNLLRWVLMCSYLYYIRGESLISDNEFDSLIQMMKDKWEIINHEILYEGSLFKMNLICNENMQTGSFFNLKEEDYPQQIQHAALRLLKACKKFKTSIDDVVNRKLFNLVSFNEMVTW